MSDRPPWLRRGIAPALLLSQVENTARWALEGEVPAEEWRDWLASVAELGDRWQLAEERVAYLRVMLAAHFTTVATFVPTDVDTHIRHHVWQEIATREELLALLQVVDVAARWDPHAVSARVVGNISGHAGEWLSVRAGALGRALAIGADDVADRIVADIDRELTLEAEAFAKARSEDLVEALRIATILAHNCGDLSRVIVAWKATTPRRAELVASLARLGHEDASRYGGELHLAGHINKEVMASENHRFLALRAPRGLRRSRSLLVPIGPFFDAWGETIGRSPLLDENDRGEILGALLRGLEQSVDRWGYHRAIAGMHRGTPGGIDRLEPKVPASLRKHVKRGPVRDTLRVNEERFLARMHNAWKAALASYRRDQQVE